MAISKNPDLKDFRGNIDKIVVIKQYATKTVLTSYPDMSKVVFNENQKREQGRFAAAVAYAKEIVKDPLKKAEYGKNLPHGTRIYQAAIKEFLGREL